MQKLTLKSVEHAGDGIIHEYDCDFKVELAGDSIWGCKLKTVKVKGITIVYSVYDDEYCTTVNVVHSGGKNSWTMYTDTGFESAISEALGFDVTFTEQGMQDDGLASMEA